MLSAPSQLLLRNQEVFNSGRWLLVNPTDSHIASELASADIQVFHQYFDVYQQSLHSSNPDKHTFSAYFSSDCEFDGVVIYMPKSKEQLKMLIANMVSCLKPSGHLMLVGENKGGIKGGAKLLTAVGETVNKVDSARHCALFVAQLEKKVTAFDVTNWEKYLDVEVAGLTYKICSLPGVFNHGAVDVGTRLLLENLPDLANGRVLDFGCGAGVIGCYLALKNPSNTVVMTDVSALAVHCAKRSSDLNQVNTEVVASNGLDKVTGKFSSVVTNPPFHTGIQTDYSVTESFIQGVNQYLGRPGSLFLVANRFLRYSDLLEKRFKVVELVEQTSKFSLYHCNRAS